PYEDLVVDEAHHLEDAATDGLRFEVDGAGVMALLTRLANVDETGRHQGLIQDILLQPRFDAAGDALLEAEPAALAAGGRVAALFEAAAEWVRARVPEDNGRRDESLR